MLANVTSVGKDAFRNCTGLTSVRYHGDRAMWESIDFASGNDRLLNAKIVFTDASGSCGEDLVWELDSSGTLLITGSGAMADYDHQNNPAPWTEFAVSIRDLRINDMITSIGSDAFAGLSALNTVYLPDSVTEIGTGAFRSCSGMTSVNLGNGVSKLGENAFAGCKNLKTITVGDALTVSAETFVACTALEAIHVSENNAACTSIDGLVYTKDGTCLIAVPRGRSGSVTLPAGVTSIGENALAGSSLTKAVLPDGLTSIGNGAFYDSLMKELNLPGTVTVIGAQAFANTHLQALLLLGSIATLGSGAFAGCAQLTSIALPAGITAIEEDTFRGCESLNAITIPASVTSIGSNAFDGCAALALVIYLGEADAFERIVVGSGNEALLNTQVVTQQTVSVVAAPKPATGKPEIKWESVAGVKKYEVHRATSIDGTYKKLTTVSTTSYTDSSASVGTEYFYKIKALYGKKAVEIGTAVSRCVCAQPKVKVSVSSATGQPTLSWGKVSGASLYVVLRSTSADGADGYTELAVQKGVKFTDKTVQPDTIYYYQVKVIAAKANANCVTPTPQRVLVPVAQPAIKVKANAESGKPEITFAELPGAESYILYRATSKKGTFKEVMTSEVPCFEDNTAAVGKRYYYKVTALGVNCETAESSYDDTYGKLPTPGITTGGQDLATGKPTIQWNQVEGATKYDIYRASKENGTYKKIKSGATGTTYTDASAKNNTTYFCKVVAVASNTKANSAKSAWYSVTSGNISAADAKIRKILIKMERYPNYLSYNAELLTLAVDLYEMDPDNPKYFQSVLTRMEDVSGNIWEIYEACGNNIHLKPLKSLYLSADFPKYQGSVSNFVRQGRGYARDAEKIVIMYNVIRESYGLEKIGNGYN